MLHAATSPDAGRETREYLSSFYANCIHSPQLTQSGITGTCANIHQPSNCDYKLAKDAWRDTGEIVVDVSHCSRFLPPRADADGTLQPQDLLPVTLALRPRSTDHDVFLQVRATAGADCCTRARGIACSAAVGAPWRIQHRADTILFTETTQCCTEATLCPGTTAP